MKKLKKLSLNKEEIVNLNDFEMRNLKGGSSVPCTIPLASATYVIATVIWDGATYAGQQLSAWNCPPQTTDSAETIWIDGYETCMLPDLYVNGLNTNP